MMISSAVPGVGKLPTYSLQPSKLPDEYRTKIKHQRPIEDSMSTLQQESNVAFEEDLPFLLHRILNHSRLDKEGIWFFKELLAQTDNRSKKIELCQNVWKCMLAKEATIMRKNNRENLAFNKRCILTASANDTRTESMTMAKLNRNTILKDTCQKIFRDNVTMKHQQGAKLHENFEDLNLEANARLKLNNKLGEKWQKRRRSNHMSSSMSISDLTDDSLPYRSSLCSTYRQNGWTKLPSIKERYGQDIKESWVSGPIQLNLNPNIFKTDSTISMHESKIYQDVFAIANFDGKVDSASTINHESSTLSTVTPHLHSQHPSDQINCYSISSGSDFSTFLSRRIKNQTLSLMKSMRQHSKKFDPFERIEGGHKRAVFKCPMMPSNEARAAIDEWRNSIDLSSTKFRKIHKSNDFSGRLDAAFSAINTPYDVRIEAKFLLYEVDSARSGVFKPTCEDICISWELLADGIISNNILDLYIERAKTSFHSKGYSGVELLPEPLIECLRFTECFRAYAPQSKLIDWFYELRHESLTHIQRMCAKLLQQCHSLSCSKYFNKLSMEKF